MEGLIKVLNERILDEIEGIRSLRQHIHEFPELGFQEFETAKSVVQFVSDIPGLDIEEGIAKTGMVVTLGKDKQGKCIAFRADMDCLPITETTGLSYASNHPGLMHACGHDGHTAIQAGLIRVLSQFQDQLLGPVKFIFQPAEEGYGGADDMVKAGVLKSPDVDMLFALHGWPEMPLGQVGSRSGAFFASTDMFEITVRGKGGHAAFPHNTVDPVLMAANVINAVQSLVSRNVDPVQSAVVSICELKGGHAVNVIPDEVIMRGTIRCFDSTVREQLKQRLKEVVQYACQAQGGLGDVKISSGYPALVCSDAATDFFFKTAKDLGSSLDVVENQPTLGGEDFAYYANMVPACMWLLGVRENELKDTPLLHTSNYNFNDDALALGIRIQAQMALRFQQHTVA